MWRGEKYVSLGVNNAEANFVSKTNTYIDADTLGQITR